MTNRPPTVSSSLPFQQTETHLTDLTTSSTNSPPPLLGTEASWRQCPSPPLTTDRHTLTRHLARPLLLDRSHREGLHASSRPERPDLDIALFGERAASHPSFRAPDRTSGTNVSIADVMQREVIEILDSSDDERQEIRISSDLPLRDTGKGKERQVRGIEWHTVDDDSDGDDVYHTQTAIQPSLTPPPRPQLNFKEKRRDFGEDVESDDEPIFLGVYTPSSSHSPQKSKRRSSFLVHEEEGKERPAKRTRIDSPSLHSPTPRRTSSLITHERSQHAKMSSHGGRTATSTHLQPWTIRTQEGAHADSGAAAGPSRPHHPITLADTNDELYEAEGDGDERFREMLKMLRRAEEQEQISRNRGTGESSSTLPPDVEIAERERDPAPLNEERTNMRTSSLTQIRHPSPQDPLHDESSGGARANSERDMDVEVDPRTATLTSVLEIIPDVEPVYLLGLVDQHLPQYGSGQIVEFLIALLFEDGSYPKLASGSGKGKASSSSSITIGGGLPRPDYTSTLRPFRGGPHYADLALQALRDSFPYVPVAFLRGVLAISAGLYVPAHLAMLEIEGREEWERGYTRKKAAGGRMKGKGREIRDDVFEDERSWLELYLESGDLNAGTETVESLENDNEKELDEGDQVEEEREDDGTFIECGCCFDKYPPDRLHSCPEGHPFCRGCVQQYAATKFGEQIPDVPCMSTSSPACKSAFSSAVLCALLPKKLRKLYDRLVFQRELKAAGLDNLVECPFCDYACVIETTPEEDKLFRCQNQEGECGVVSCRLCRRREHLPRTCKEVEEERFTDGRLAIEEAMTKALMRKCPTCGKAFVKSDGCNKMTCSCGTTICYVCKKQITNGYQHFDRAPNFCPSNDANGVNERHEDEVRQAYAQAVADYKRDHPEFEEGKDIKVDLTPPRPTSRPRPVPGLQRRARRLPRFQDLPNVPEALMLPPLHLAKPWRTPLAVAGAQPGYDPHHILDHREDNGVGQAGELHRTINYGRPVYADGIDAARGGGIMGRDMPNIGPFNALLGFGQPDEHRNDQVNHIPPLDQQMPAEEIWRGLPVEVNRPYEYQQQRAKQVAPLNLHRPTAPLFEFAQADVQLNVHNYHAVPVRPPLNTEVQRAETEVERLRAQLQEARAARDRLIPGRRVAFGGDVAQRQDEVSLFIAADQRVLQLQQEIASSERQHQQALARQQMFAGAWGMRMMD